MQIDDHTHAVVATYVDQTHVGYSVVSSLPETKLGHAAELLVMGQYLHRQQAEAVLTAVYNLMHGLRTDPTEYGLPTDTVLTSSEVLEMGAHRIEFEGKHILFFIDIDADEQDITATSFKLEIPATHWQPQPTWEESLGEIMTGEHRSFTSKQVERVRQLLRKYVQ